MPTIKIININDLLYTCRNEGKQYLDYLTEKINQKAEEFAISHYDQSELEKIKTLYLEAYLLYTDVKNPILKKREFKDFKKMHMPLDNDKLSTYLGFKIIKQTD